MLPALRPKLPRPSPGSFAKFTPTHGLKNPSADACEGQPMTANAAATRKIFSLLRTFDSFVGEAQARECKLCKACTPMLSRFGGFARFGRFGRFTKFGVREVRKVHEVPANPRTPN